MRFIAIVVQFTGILLSFQVLVKVLPECCVGFYTFLAHIFLSMYLAAWICQLTQAYLLTSRLPTKNKVVLITGCDSGFGNALAERLDKKGFKVYACCLYSSGDGAQKLKDTCSNNLQLVQMDVTDEQSIQRAKDFVTSDLNNLDLWAVVNNAGVLKGFQIELCSTKDFEDCMEVNAMGPVRVTRAFLPLLRKSRGRVINICSLSGRIPINFMAAYTMSKHAAVAFTEVAMQELREFGIRVISIEPEFFNTPMCSNEHVNGFLETALENVDEETQAEYGNQYTEKASKCYQAIFAASSTNINLVLEAIEDGIILKYPADLYKPCGNLFKKIILFSAERLPRILREILCTIILYFMGLPKPKSGVNLCHKLLYM